jgi:hypothetical protein
MTFFNRLLGPELGVAETSSPGGTVRGRTRTRTSLCDRAELAVGRCPTRGGDGELDIAVCSDPAYRGEIRRQNNGLSFCA